MFESRTTLKDEISTLEATKASQSNHMNQRIKINFTTPEGKRGSDTFGIRQCATGYARLLCEQGYTVQSITNMNTGESIEVPWPKGAQA